MHPTLGILPILWAALATGPVPEREILVFGAASLTEALLELGKSFEAKSGTGVIFSFGSSSDLARQIAAGAPADVFFSADTSKMDALENAGIVRRENRREFLSNTLVAVVPAGSKVEIRSAEDLVGLPRIALADPASVPAGIYAKRWLESLGLWERVRPRVVPMLDVRAALAAVEAEAVPAAIVYRTDAAIAKAARVAYAIPDGPDIRYSLAPVAASDHRAAADAFVAFLAGEAGRVEFRRRGFRILPAR